MAHSDKTYFSTVYCWREKDRSIVKANFFSFEGSDEKFLYNLDSKVTSIGDDLVRGFKFVGDGSYAVLPETRLKVDVNAFFRGELKAYALRRKEQIMKMNIVCSANSDRTVRLCSVLTFDDNFEEIDFGGSTFQLKPKPTREERQQMKESKKKQKEKVKQPSEGKRERKEAKTEKNQSLPTVAQKAKEPKSKSKELADRKTHVPEDANNPTWDDLTSKKMMNNPPIEDNATGCQVAELEELMNTNNIGNLKNSEVSSDSSDDSESDSSDSEDGEEESLRRAI